jgi:hypothetical protein
VVQSGRVGRWIATFAVAAVLSFAFYYGVRITWDLSVDPHDVDYVGSSNCEPCHGDNHRSFARTYHGRMTREADDATVLGDFDGAELEYGGVLARMERGEEGEFLMTFSGPGFARRVAEVVRTVGSHRYQQYLARDDDLYIRLPVAWDPKEERWFHMNEAFLTPDPEPPPAGGSIRREDYDRHVVRWNDNCVFCHNVAPNPGRIGERFETEVAELGVACEACHGPGAAHADARGDPIRSLALDIAPDDPTIVSPEDLDGARSNEVCGRCHGQRKTDDIDAFMTRGDPFVPGDALTEYSTPLDRETTLDGNPGVFAPRFWRDGTPRLTAYSYQGLLQSPCTADADFTCTHCHGMHEGDPDGQLRPEAMGDGACVDCHEALGRNDALEAHAHHPASSSGARCVACHMPRIVYGLVGARISHRIEVPDVEGAEAAGRPDACTLCHVDETRAWARDAAAELWGEGASGPAAGDGEVSAVLAMLFGGDPIERAVAADALGQPRRAASRETRAARLGALFDVCENDPYPALRRIAWRSARALAEAPDAPWQAYVATDDAESRREAVAAIERALPEGSVVRPSLELTAPLRDAAARVAIHIGE